MYYLCMYFIVVPLFIVVATALLIFLSLLAQHFHKKNMFSCLCFDVETSKLFLLLLKYSL